MGGKETIGDYYRRFDSEQNPGHIERGFRLTPEQLPLFIKIAASFKVHGLTYPDSGFAFKNPEEAVVPHTPYPLVEYRIGDNDQKTLVTLLSTLEKKQAQYSEMGLTEDIIEEVTDTIIDVTVSELGKREKLRKRLVDQALHSSKRLSENRPKTRVTLTDDTKKAFEKAKKEGTLTPQSLQEVGLSMSTARKVLRGEENISRSSLRRLSLAANVPVSVVTRDGEKAIEAVDETAVFCRKYLSSRNES